MKIYNTGIINLALNPTAQKTQPMAKPDRVEISFKSNDTYKGKYFEFKDSQDFNSFLYRGYDVRDGMAFLVPGLNKRNEITVGNDGSYKIGGYSGF